MAGQPTRNPAEVLGDTRRLALLSFLVLFVELALIRWAGSNVVYLSYFSNFILLGSFLGIGLGFLAVSRRARLFSGAPAALATLVAFVHYFPPKIDRSGSQLIYFGEFEPSGVPIWIILPVVFVSVAVVMATIAEGLARVFVRMEPLDAYRIDILGAVGGIVAFTALAFLRAPPVVWGIVAAASFAVLYGRSIRWSQIVALVVLVFILLGESLQPRDSWSPYYTVTVTPTNPAAQVFRVDVNGIPHQTIEPVALRRKQEPIYFLPYEGIGSGELRDVLVVGAGNGTDVAIALDRGAEHVDAVEIDPRLYELGRDLHSDHPYSDPRVDVHITDGRAFLEAASRSYDMILFALPDSLTLVSGQSSLRLESYLFTDEALRQARDHLDPDGTFAMYNFYRERWLIDRLANTLASAFGHSPCVHTVGASQGLAALTIGKDPAATPCPPETRTVAPGAPAPATDDHPFPYLRDKGIPGFYLLTILLILGVSTVAIRALAGPLGPMASYADLFFMGAAFLLLETKNVVGFALLFGTTWLVNALVFLGILLCVLAGVEIARRVTVRRPGRLYAVLILTLAAAWAVPPSALLTLPATGRFAAATALAFAPIIVANIVFAVRFKNTASSAVAFAANLLGAMFGGLLEYGSLLVGYRALLIGAAALYGLAFWFGRRHFLPQRAA